jgi:HK97 family phage prohead protease
LPNSFKETLEERDIKKSIKLLWQHSAEEPIGYFDVIREDNVGLYVEGKILLDIEKGREAYSLIKTGAISGLSIGYNVKKAKFDDNNGTRIISKIDLWEISVVTFPANKLSNITFCKSYNPISETKEFKKFNKNLDRAIEILKFV